jgi:two-component system OmpR family sensor kinase
MLSTRTRFTISHAVVGVLTLIAFAVAFDVARRQYAVVQLGREVEADADEVMAAMKRAVHEQGISLTAVDTGLNMLRARANLPAMREVLDPLPGYFIVYSAYRPRSISTPYDDTTKRIYMVDSTAPAPLLYQSSLIKTLPPAVEQQLRTIAESLQVNAQPRLVVLSASAPDRRLSDWRGWENRPIVLVARRGADLPLGDEPKIAPWSGEVSHVVMAMPADLTDVPTTMLLGLILLVAPVVILFSLVVAYLTAPAALQRVGDLINDVEAITDGRSLHRRLPADRADDELGRLTGTVNAMLARLETSFAGLRRFTADASHELRTPLTVLRADVERAMNPDTEPTERLVALEESLQEIARMADLVDSLLTLARADEGRFDLVRARVNLGALLRDVFETALILGDEAGLDLNAEGIEDIAVMGEEVRLRQVMLNLLTNAIKYTPKGGRVTLAMRRVEGAGEGQGTQEVAISVRDTGIGVATTDLPHVFDRFWRADQARSRTSGSGFGLGLAICQWVAQAHGGTLTVQSRLGRGSVFTLTLPIAPPEVEPAPAQPEVERGRAIERRATEIVRLD